MSGISKKAIACLVLIIFMLSTLTASLHGSQVIPVSNDTAPLADHQNNVDPDHTDACDEDDADSPIHSDNCCGVSCFFITPAAYKTAPSNHKIAGFKAPALLLIEPKLSRLLRPPIFHPI